MTLAWDFPVPPTKKLVLLAMCDWANDAGYCFPSMATVARRTCISKRQCQRIMGELIAGELIAVVANLQGGAGSRRYQINVDALRKGSSFGTGDKLTPVNHESSGPATTAHKPGDRGVARTATTRQSDPPLPQQVNKKIDWRYLPQFTECERVVVVDLLKGMSATEHQEVIDELAGALRAKAIRGQWPGWLRGLVRRAQNGGFTPNHALTIQQDRRRVAREALEAEARRVEEKRRNDPAARAKGLEAMAAAVAALANPET
jgi:hypothetical protein